VVCRSGCGLHETPRSGSVVVLGLFGGSGHVDIDVGTGVDVVG
jgi:hypothetical protein